MSLLQRRHTEEMTIKTLLMISAVWLACQSIAYAQDVDPIGIGKRTESLGIVGVLAAVIVILVSALVIVYRGKEQQQAQANAQLQTLVERVCTAVEHSSDVIEKCRKGGA